MDGRNFSGRLFFVNPRYNGWPALWSAVAPQSEGHTVMFRSLAQILHENCRSRLNSLFVGSGSLTPNDVFVAVTGGLYV